MSTINWQDLIKTAGSGFEPIPDGDYNVTVAKAEAVTASTGSPMIKATLVIEDGPHAGRKLFNNFVLTLDNPDALSFFFQHMQALGLDRNFFASLQGSIEQSMPTVAQSIQNRRCRVGVGQRSWQGQMRNNVQRVMPALVGMGAPVLGGQAAPSVPLGQPQQMQPAPVTQPTIGADTPPQPVAQPVAQPQPQVQQPVPQDAQPQPVPQVPVEPEPQPVASAATPAAPIPPAQDAQYQAYLAAQEAARIAAERAAALQPQGEATPTQPEAAPAPPF